ncbi:MAG: PA14 domain-containing protein, partial [Nocardioides sp.]|uniref:PA14 domain-containing protein n=1 Tax=Nocardioides sp. TaxID=35761 RepID=UPI00326668BF
DPLSYSWVFGDGTTSNEPNPTKTYAAKGVYTARLTVSAAGEQAIAQPIVIQVGIPPELIVATPTAGQLYRAGDTITYNAFATDAAGFDLNDANIKTEVRLHHGTHFHPFVGPLTGRAGSLKIPATGEASADTSFEVEVTATDTNGLSTSKVVNILPRKSQISLATSPAGLGVVVDGVSVSTPRTITGVEGFKRDLFAPANAVAQDGTLLQFAGWSDGKSIKHVITTPVDDTTYTATYVPAEPFTARYYDNTTFTGAPVITRQDPTINFAWGSGSPDPALPVNGFSVRWTKTQYFGPGRYRFTTVADDGVRLFIDGRRVVNQWRGPVNTEFSHVADLGQGLHTIKMEFVEQGGDATASLRWDSTSDQPSGIYLAQYWNAPEVNEIPSTSPELVLEEETIDHDWGDGSPGPGIGANRFVARWTRTLSLAPGDYEFAVTADDGVRLNVDGVRVIDQWMDQGPTTYRTTLPLDGGPHRIVMDYYENGAGAVARLGYTEVGPPPTDDGYEGQYWNIAATDVPTIPTGPADLVRTDDTLDFDWDVGSPGAGITPDRFVARWTKSVVLTAGIYRFTGGRDDGMRAYVDNAPVIDAWTFGNADYSVDKVVSGGPHDVRIDYFEAGGGARAEFNYERVGDVVATTDGGYAAEYFANRDLAGTPLLTRTDDTVDFNWGGGSPGDGVPVNNFSARWTKTLNVAEAGAYKFTVTSDDGVRLFVDGQPVIDKWVLQGATTHTATCQLSQGSHQVVLEYFEANGDAVARFSYEPTSGPPPPPPPPPEPFVAEYFDNSTLSGGPVLTRSDDTIDFDWSDGSPAPTVPSNQFSARWTRTKSYAAGTYRFSVTGDDGIRVLIDETPVIDGWFYQAPTTYSTDVALPAGEHTVVVEYFEWSGGAVARFNEARLPDPAP